MAVKCVICGGDRVQCRSRAKEEHIRVLRLSVKCPFCYNSPAVICCALCGGRGIVSVNAAAEYGKIKHPTVNDRIRIRQKYTGEFICTD